MAKRKKPEYLWTVMVYLAGDNNLTEESVFSLTEMKKVKTDDRIAVIAQLDPKSSTIPSHRYVITPETANRVRSKGVRSADIVAADARPIREPTIKFRDQAERNARARRSKAQAFETDTGDPATLFDFISWSTENFRADRYIVILAGHGAGTEADFLLKDDNPTNSLSMRALQEVFDAVKRELSITIDILGMDVCLMSMVEVCHQLNVPFTDERQPQPLVTPPLVHYLVSSESFSPTAGWPYGQILQKLQIERNAKTEDVARMIVGEYIGFYSDYVVGGLSVDQSVLKVSGSTGMAASVKNLTNVLQGELPKQEFKDALVLAHWEAQSYNGEQFVDLRDLCELLKKRYGNVAQACDLVIKAIDGLVLKSCYTGVENQFSNGVSIYFPWAEVAPSYRDLAFAADGGWHDFLQAYVAETRRKPREFTESSELLLDFPGEAAVGIGSGAMRPGQFRKSEERKSEERGVNPIHSMRNPPTNVTEKGLSKCVRENSTAVRGLKEFSKIATSTQRR
jgi:hypothetical protein